MRYNKTPGNVTNESANYIHFSRLLLVSLSLSLYSLLLLTLVPRVLPNNYRNEPHTVPIYKHPEEKKDTVEDAQSLNVNFNFEFDYSE